MMTDIQVLDLLEDFLFNQYVRALFMLDAMESFEVGDIETSWQKLFMWCEAEDNREAAWKKLKPRYMRAVYIKEGWRKK